MRKLLCVTPLFPSAEKPFYCIYLLQQLQALKNYGFEVSVLVPRPADAYSQREETFEGLRVLRVGYRELKGDFKTFVDKDISACKYDVIALNLCNRQQTAFFLRYSMVPVVVHFHGLNVWENYHEKYPLYAKWMKLQKIRQIRRADAIIGVSDKVRAVARKHYPAEKIYTVYNGVNPDLFYPRPRADKDTFDIYCVANLIPIKGHAYLLRALASARQSVRDRNIRLHIIGDGPLKDSLVRLCRDLNIEDAVLFEGEMLYDKVAERMGQDADMFIMPSYFESLGCVYLEAMACEVPALGVRGCGIDEVITDGVNGFLVDPQNTEQITERIVFALEHPKELQKIAAEGKNTVLNNFTWDASGKTLAETYERIIKNYERV